MASTIAENVKFKAYDSECNPIVFVNCAYINFSSVIKSRIMPLRLQSIKSEPLT